MAVLRFFRKMRVLIESEEWREEHTSDNAVRKLTVSVALFEDIYGLNLYLFKYFSRSEAVLERD